MNYSTCRGTTVFGSSCGRVIKAGGYCPTHQMQGAIVLTVEAEDFSAYHAWIIDERRGLSWEGYGDLGAVLADGATYGYVADSNADIVIRWA